MGNAMKRTPSMLVPSNASIKSKSGSPPPPATPPPTTPPAARISSDRDSDTASIATSKEKKGSIRSRMGKAIKRTSSMLTPATPRSSGSIDSMDTKIDVSPAVLSPPPTVSTAPLVSPIAESPVIVQPAFASFSSPPPEQAQAVTVSGTSDDLPLPPTDDLASVPATSTVTDEPEAMSESDLSPPVRADVIAPETEKAQEPETEKVQQVEPEDIPAAPQMQIERSNSTSSYEVVSAPQEEEVQLSSQEEVQPTHHVDLQPESQNEVSPAAPKQEEAKPDVHEEEEKEEQNEPALTAEKVEPTVLEEVPVFIAVEEPQVASHDEQNILLPTGSSLELPSTHQPPALSDFEIDLAEALADEPEHSTNGSASLHEPVSKAPLALAIEKPKLEIIHPLSPVFPSHSHSHSHPLSISAANSTTTATTAVTVAAETDPLLPPTQANGSAAYPPGTKLSSGEATNSSSSKTSSAQGEKPFLDRFIEWLWSWIPWDAVVV